MNAIEFKNLSFSYNPSAPILKDVSFTIEKGEYVSIVGHNGSGKSTLAKLIIGLIAPNGGSIYIDGEELTRKTVIALRQKMALVFQNPDNQFIGATVEDDIAFGLENHQVPHKDMQEIIENFARKVGMIDYLQKEPSKLSGGQKQRVAIARAFLKNAPILVLDEATSALDSETEDAIQKSFATLSKNRTTIVIAHRLSTLRNMDKLIVLDKGRIVETGTHKQLLSKNGIYAKLWKMQSGGFISE